MSALSCVLFDLDGTLLDTAPDMGRALNRLRREQGHPPLSFEDIRPVVSHGSPGLLALGFGVSPGNPSFDGLRERFLDLYRQCLAGETRLFGGMARVLQWLEDCAIPWGVVTNKPGALTTPLLMELELDRRAACVVSGDTLPLRKPHPEPLLHACRQVGISATDCVYVGDAARDMEAGRRAGMRTVVARYGYISPGEPISDWGADHIIDSPEELIPWFGPQP